MLKEKKKKKENQKLNYVELNSKFLSFYLKANTATVSPPLSSVLGNFGLNTMKFCKEFNNLTEHLVSYFILKVYVKINLAFKTWVIKIGSMPITHLYRLISLKMKVQLTGLGGFFVKEYFYITLLNFFLVILFFNKKINRTLIKNNLSIVRSMNMLVVHDNIILNLNVK